jgi:hypothetical protein
LRCNQRHWCSYRCPCKRDCITSSPGWEPDCCMRSLVPRGDTGPSRSGMNVILWLSSYNSMINLGWQNLLARNFLQLDFTKDDDVQDTKEVFEALFTTPVWERVHCQWRMFISKHLLPRRPAQHCARRCEFRLHRYRTLFSCHSILGYMINTKLGLKRTDMSQSIGVYRGIPQSDMENCATFWLRLNVGSEGGPLPVPFPYPSSCSLHLSYN